MDSKALFGRYYPADSPVHRLDPRTKLVLSLCAFAAVLAAQGPVALGACAAFVGLFYALARIPARDALRAAAPLVALVAVTGLLNLLFVSQGAILWQLGPLAITDRGIASAAFLSCRLAVLVLVACLLTLTTTTLDLTEAIEQLCGPLRRLGAPVHEMAMMMGLALRFLPLIARELQSIYRAQASRCAQLGPNPFRGGLRALQALVVPLFAGALRRADTVAMAMEARCYHGGDGRTRLHPLAFHGRDAMAACIVLAMAALVAALDFARASGMV